MRISPYLSSVMGRLQPSAAISPAFSGGDTFVSAEALAAGLTTPVKSRSYANALQALLDDAAAKKLPYPKVFGEISASYPRMIGAILEKHVKDFGVSVPKNLMVTLATALRSNIPDAEGVLFSWRVFRFGPVLLKGREAEKSTRWLRRCLNQKLVLSRSPAEVEQLLRNAPRDVLNTFHNVVAGTHRDGARVDIHTLSRAVFGKSNAQTRGLVRDWEEMWTGIALRLGWKTKILLHPDLAEKIENMQSFSGGQGFNLEKVKSIYRALRRVYQDGDESGVYYYFPEEMQRIDAQFKDYLGVCGWEPERMDEDLEAIKKQVLECLWISGASSLEEIVPPHFVRSDSLLVQDPMTGEPVDLTSFAVRLWKENRKDSEKLMRVVALKSRTRENNQIEKKFYFIDQAELMEQWHLLRYPTFEGLKKNLGTPIVFEKYLRLKMGDNILKEFALVGRKWNDGLGAGLRVVSVEATTKLAPNYFQLYFTEHGKRLFKVQGVGGLELGFAWLEGSGVQLKNSPVEKSFVAGFWGVKPQAKAGENYLPFTDLKNYLSHPRFIRRLAYLYQCLAGLDAPPQEFFLVGMKEKYESVGGFRLLPGNDIGQVKSGFFQLHFMEEGTKLVGVQGNKGLELGFAWLAGTGLKLEGPVEQSLVAGLLGGHCQAQKGERTLYFKNVKNYLRSPLSAERLVALYQHLRGGESPPQEFVLTGCKRGGKYVSSFLIILDRNDPALKYHNFRLHFSDSGKRLLNARGVGGRELENSWLRGNSL